MLISAGIHYCEKIQNNSGSFKMIGVPLLCKVFLGVFFHLFFQIFHFSKCLFNLFSLDFIFLQKKTVLHFTLYTLRSTLYEPSAAPLELLSLLCNPSPPLPQYHFSSPCKLSCSEPQRMLLSVELRSSSP